METRVITVAIGGGTCSGKTTLAKQISRILPNCPLLNQDHYCIHEKNLPLHPVHQVPDPDEAETAIDWVGFRNGFKNLVEQGRGQEMTFNLIDVDASSSFGHLSEGTLNQWKNRFLELQSKWLSQGLLVQWRMVEGFIIFYDSELAKLMDIKLFIRTPGHIMEARREFRVFENGDGTFWTPPPNYWENIAYPAYIRAHTRLFEAGDVEQGNISPDYTLIETTDQGQDVDFEKVFGSAAEVILLGSQRTLV